MQTSQVQGATVHPYMPGCMLRTTASLALLQPRGVPKYGRSQGENFGGVMFGCCVILMTGALLLTGCVSDGVGTDYAAISQKVGPPKPGQSRIVVLQQKREGLSMALCACDVKFDGSPIGKVIVGTYAYADRPAGPHRLVAGELLFPGETVRDFSTAARPHLFLSRQVERSA